MLPGMVLLLTARVLRRHYLFKPNSETNRAFEYFLAVYAEKYGIEVLCGVVMSTHYHLVIRDRRGRRPDLLRDLNHQMALFIQRKWGWEGKVFQETPNQVVLFTREAVAQKIGYVVANPPASGAVETPEEWNGFRTTVDEMVEGDSSRPAVRKPRQMRQKAGSRRKSVLPDKARLKISLPVFLMTPFEKDAHGRLRKKAEAVRLTKKWLAEAVERELAKVREKVEKKGGRLGGVDWRSIDPFQRAVAYEPYGELKPKVSFIGLEADEIRAVLDAEIGFQVEHAICRERLCNGEKDILWPDGTWMANRCWGQRAN